MHKKHQGRNKLQEHQRHTQQIKKKISLTEKQNTERENKFPHTQAANIWMFQHSLEHPAYHTQTNTQTKYNITPSQANNHRVTTNKHILLPLNTCMHNNKENFRNRKTSYAQIRKTSKANRCFNIWYNIRQNY